MAAGLYDENDVMIVSWDELVNDYGLDISSNYSYDNRKTSTSSFYYILENNEELTSGSKLVIGDVPCVGDYSFSDINLTSIIISDSVTSIGEYAFNGLENLSLITIPKSVTDIGAFAFMVCNNLKTINYLGTEEEWNEITKAGAWNAHTPSDMVIKFKTLTEPDYNTPGSYDFDGNLLQTWDSIGVDVTVDKKPWDSDLLNVYLHEDAVSVVVDSVSAIGTYQFYGANNLLLIALSEGITTIKNNAFVCSNLKTIIIPESVTSIDSSAFQGCTNLTTIYYSGTATGAPWGATNATVLPNE